MTPDEVHFGHVRLPSSSSDIIPSPENKNSPSDFSRLNIEEDFILKLKKMKIIKPADIQVSLYLKKKLSFLSLLFNTISFCTDSIHTTHSFWGELCGVGTYWMW